MSPLLTAAIELTIAGMGTVFVFLTVLVIATQLMSRVIATVVESPANHASEFTPEEEVAAIAAAIRAHRSGT